MILFTLLSMVVLFFVLVRHILFHLLAMLVVSCRDCPNYLERLMHHFRSLMDANVRFIQLKLFINSEFLL